MISARQTTHCATDDDCPNDQCGHKEVNNCVIMHGSGGGTGENYCECQAV